MNESSKKRLIRISEKYKALNEELENELKGETRGEYAGRYFSFEDMAVKVLGLDEDDDIEYLIVRPVHEHSESDLFVYQREFLTKSSGRTVKNTFGQEITKKEFEQVVWCRFRDVFYNN